jgi:hypothetical protein
MIASQRWNDTRHNECNRRSILAAVQNLYEALQFQRVSRVWLPSLELKPAQWTQALTKTGQTNVDLPSSRHSGAIDGTHQIDSPCFHSRHSFTVKYRRALTTLIQMLSNKQILL